MEHAAEHAIMRSESTSSAHTAYTKHYTAQQLADDHPDLNPKPVTIRTRWISWAEKVAPKRLLKVEQGYTELCRTLIGDYAQRVKRDGLSADVWVDEEKARFSQEWEPHGIIDGELMPDEVGGALATLQTQGTALQHQLASKLDQLNEFVEQIADVEANFSKAELQTMRAKGAIRGVQRFKVEMQSELQTYNQLRQQHLNNQS